MDKIQIIRIKSDLGASKKGASLGPDAIIKASLDKGSDLFRRFSSDVLEPSVEGGVDDFSGKYAKNIDQIVRITNQLANLVLDSLSQKQFLFILSGDHSTAAGSLAGLKMAYPGERIGVVWIDAHADLHSPFTTPSGNLHGMPLAASLGLDSLHLQRNQVDEQTIRSWNLFKNLGGISPKFKPEDLVYIGLRQMESEEETLIHELHIPVITVAELQQAGAEKTGSKVLGLLKDCQHILVSFDVDSLDPAVSVATGTPVEGGLTREEALVLLRFLCVDQRVNCLEIVEINPELESGNTMGEIGFEIVDTITQLVKKQSNHAY